MFKRLAVCASFAITACAPLFPQQSLDFESKSKLATAGAIQTFPVGAVHPEVAETLGPIESHSCAYWQFTHATEADALKRLQLEAAKSKADGIIDVSFDDSNKGRWAITAGKASRRRVQR